MEKGERLHKYGFSEKAQIPVSGFQREHRKATKVKIEAGVSGSLRNEFEVDALCDWLNKKKYDCLWVQLSLFLS